MASPASDRRRFLSRLTSLLGGFVGLGLAIPAVAYFCSPLRRTGSAARSFSLVGPLSAMPLGQWVLRSVEVVRADGWKKSSVNHAIWVRRQGTGPGDITVLSTICPHLGCSINWHTDNKQFQCPCHGGVFTADGRRVSGPPPRSMDKLDYEVRGEHLWVRWQDFKNGVADQIPVA